MALTNTESDLYAKVRQILEGDADWSETFQSGRRFWEDDTPGTNEEHDLPAADGDFPRAMLTLQNGATDLFDGDPTFGTYAPDYDPANAHWTETSIFVFELVLISQLIDAREQGRLGAMTRRALRAGGPRLGGLDYVNSLRLEWRTTKSSTEDETHEVNRYITRITIRVGTQTDGNKLLGTE